MPYRDSRQVDVPELTPDPGIVDDMVRQFADPYAYLRELVQNGIDAGATRLEIRIERDIDGTVRTSIDDDGSGMTRATIEGPLLTLFASSKESDETKIGKYGIGFVSVFATAPKCVEVLTRHESESWLLRLFGDHSFELRPGERNARGTTVTLVHTMTSEQLVAHGKRAAAALHHWCRHARLPIRLEIVDLANEASNARGSANMPFSVRGPISVKHDQGDLVIVASIGPVERDVTEGSATFAGFYNRGLTLHESTLSDIHALEGIRFKVEWPRLSHTLSRDAVKQDASYHKAIAAVRALVEGELLQRVRETLSEHAASGDMASYLTLFIAARNVPAFETELESFEVPLVEQIGKDTKMSIVKLRKLLARDGYAANASTRITRALAREGTPVIRFVELASLVEPILDRRIVDADATLAHATTDGVELRPEDGPLLSRLSELLQATGRSTRAIVLASFSGVSRHEMYRLVETDQREALTHPEPWRPGKRPKRRWGRRATLFLDVEDAYVRLARRRAKSDPRAAAHLLCRSMLLVDGPLVKRDVDKLLAAELA